MEKKQKLTLLNHISRIQETIKHRETLIRVAMLWVIVIESFIVVIDKSAWVVPMEGQLFRLTFLLCFLSVLMTTYTWQEYLVIATGIFIAGISYMATGQNDLLRIVMFVAACKRCDVKCMLKVTFAIQSIGICMITILSLAGIGGGMFLLQDYGRGAQELRYTFGMGHPNAAQCMIVMMSVLFVYIVWDRLNVLWLIGILGINLIVYLFTNSRTGMLIAFYFTISAMIAKCIKNCRLQKIFLGIEVLSIYCSILISVFFASTAMELDRFLTGEKKEGFLINVLRICDRLLTGRISSLCETINNEGTIGTWSLLSCEHNFNYYFDMGWIRVFYWYGIIPGVLMLILLSAFVSYLYKKQMTKELVLLSALAVYTVFEAHLVSAYIGRNYILLILGMYWYQLFSENNKGKIQGKVE